MRTYGIPVCTSACMSGRDHFHSTSLISSTFDLLLLNWHSTYKVGFLLTPCSISNTNFSNKNELTHKTLAIQFINPTSAPDPHVFFRFTEKNNRIYSTFSSGHPSFSIASPLLFTGDFRISPILRSVPTDPLIVEVESEST